MAEIAETLSSRYGKEAMQDALAIAGKHAKDDAHGARILAFALAAAAAVPEFRGEDAEALYDCPECLDKSFVIVRQRSKADGLEQERVMGCQRCDAGLAFDAGGWMEIIHPRATNGERQMNDRAGWQVFNRYFQSNSTRRDLVLERMRLQMGTRK
jgi:hypothetical protein